MKKKQKPAYLKVRLPAIKSSGGGVHQSEKGGKYRRSQEKKRAWQVIKAELD